MADSPGWVKWVFIILGIIMVPGSVVAGAYEAILMPSMREKLERCNELKVVAEGKLAEANSRMKGFTAQYAAQKKSQQLLLAKATNDRDSNKLLDEALKRIKQLEEQLARANQASTKCANDLAACKAENETSTVKGLGPSNDAKKTLNKKVTYANKGILATAQRCIEKAHNIECVVSFLNQRDTLAHLIIYGERTNEGSYLIDDNGNRYSVRVATGKDSTKKVDIRLMPGMPMNVKFIASKPNKNFTYVSIVAGVLDLSRDNRTGSRGLVFGLKNIRIEH